MIEALKQNGHGFTINDPYNNIGHDNHIINYIDDNNLNISVPVNTSPNPSMGYLVVMLDNIVITKNSSISTILLW